MNPHDIDATGFAQFQVGSGSHGNASLGSNAARGSKTVSKMA
jgi:hypothetical protein